MILNLLENAVRHTPAGHDRLGEPGRRRRAKPSSRFATTAPGCPAGFEDSVFDRFVRGAGPRRQPRDGEGTGLGLSIVRAVATSHGGTVQRSDRTRGWRELTIRLPLAKSRRPQAEPSAAA